MTACAWFVSNQAGGGAAETAATEQLKSMGALATLGPDRKSVKSVSLLTLRSKDDLGEAVGLLKSLPKLTNLDLKGTELTGDLMAEVSRSKGLISLTLSRTQVTDEDVTHLVGLRNLQSLFLSGTNVTGASMPTIAKLSKLRILDLTESTVTGGLAPLAKLPQLDWLLLRDMRIDDDSLGALGKSKSLKRLSLQGSTVANEKSLDTLRAERSGISVELE